MTRPPSPAGRSQPVADRIRELDALLGRERFVEVCCDLLGGAPRTSYAQELRYLAGNAFGAGEVPDPASWKDYWIRTWGARGLLHCWSDRATEAVVAGLGDEHYRPAEMCLKIAAGYDVAGAGPGAARLATHDLPRVRGQAVRTLGHVGDTEHVALVREALDDPDPAVRLQAAHALARLAKRLDLPATD